MRNEFLVKIIPSQMRVSARRADFYCVVSYLQNRNIECPSAKVVNHYFFIFLFIQAVGERRGRRLIQNPFYLKTCNLSGGFCRLPLRIVKIRGNWDDRLLFFFSDSYPLSQLCFSSHQRT